MIRPLTPMLKYRLIHRRNIHHENIYRITEVKEKKACPFLIPQPHPHAPQSGQLPTIVDQQYIKTKDTAKPKQLRKKKKKKTLERKEKKNLDLRRTRSSSYPHCFVIVRYFHPLFSYRTKIQSVHEVGTKTSIQNLNCGFGNIQSLAQKGKASNWLRFFIVSVI